MKSALRVSVRQLGDLVVRDANVTADSDVSSRLNQFVDDVVLMKDLLYEVVKLFCMLFFHFTGISKYSRYNMTNQRINTNPYDYFYS